MKKFLFICLLAITSAANAQQFPSKTIRIIIPFTAVLGRLLDLVRGHWGIENELHWVLDVAFREDANKTRLGHAGENLAWLRRIALSLLKRTPGKGSIKGKRLTAGWDDGFLSSVLRQVTDI